MNSLLSEEDKLHMITDADIFAARILIVDDQEANIRLLEQMLASAGYSAVASTRDWREVCALPGEIPFDLILLDLATTESLGFTVLERLRGVESTKGAPVLVVASEPDLRRRALQIGARDFIGRPFDLVELKARIRNLLELRLLQRRLERHHEILEIAVLARTAELRASEERFQRFTELSSDCYWELDATGRQTQVSGPAMEMLGLGGEEESVVGEGGSRWDGQERAVLRANISARRPFLDLICSRIDLDGSRHVFQISGEPFFGPSGAYAGYRGIGLEITGRLRA